MHGHTLKNIRDLFKSADLNGDGVLDCDEITFVLKQLDIPFSTNQVENNFAHVLTNGGVHGLLLEEFTELITQHHHPRTADLIDRHRKGEDVLQATGEAAESLKRHALVKLGKLVDAQKV